MIEALLDHLWQSTLFMATAGVLTLLLRGNGAGARHTIWFVASMKFLVPFSLLVQLGSMLSWLAPLPAQPVLESFAPAIQPFSTTAPTVFINAPAGADIALWLLVPGQ